ncbi:MAG: hypothetical protein WA867_20835, partial [Candidatus Acidiferrales bacterium]
GNLYHRASMTIPHDIYGVRRRAAAFAKYCRFAERPRRGKPRQAPQQRRAFLPDASNENR